MGEIVDVKTEKIVTAEGLPFIRRVRTVRYGGNRYRYPVDYFDATPGPVLITKEERERVKAPGYAQLI